MDYASTLLKLLSAFVLLMLYIRISGRSQLAPLTASDTVGNIVIGALVGTTIMNPNVEVHESIFVVTAWLALQLFVRYFKFRSSTFQRILDGGRLQIVKDGALIVKNFSRSNLTVRDFETTLHQQDIDGVRDIANAWLEPSGQITVDKCGSEKQSTLIIANGDINTPALEGFANGEAWVEQHLAKLGVEASDVFCAEWLDGVLWVYTMDGHVRSTETEWPAPR